MHYNSNKFFPFFVLQFILFVLLLFNAKNCSAQLSGTYSIPGSYPTIAAAVNDLNALGVSGHVVINVAAGHTETAPVDGIVLEYAGGVPLANHSNAAQTIIFQKSGVGANPLVTAYTGIHNIADAVRYDGIVKIVGVDYVIFDAIDLSESGANATITTWMEFGYGLLRVSNTNGAQNCTIRNCVITLNNSHTGTWTGLANAKGAIGILSVPITNNSTTLLTTVGASAAGTNSNNSFSTNTILNTTTGIFITGIADATSPYTFYDQSNTAGSIANGNAIENFKSHGVYCAYQNNIAISYNSLDNDASSGAAATSTIYGIFHDVSINTSPIISFNAIKMNCGVFAVAGICAAINETTSGLGTVTINNNDITLTGGSVASVISFYGILRNIILTSKSALTIENNIFSDINVSFINSGLNGVFRLFYNDANTITTVNFNNNSLTGAATPYLNITSGNAAPVALYYNLATSTTGSITIQNNSFTNIQVSNSTHFHGFMENMGSNSIVPIVKTISGNTLSNFTIGGGTTIGIQAYSGGTILDVYNNYISNISGPNVFWAMNLVNFSNVNAHNNIIQNISAIAQYKGIYLSGQVFGSVYENIISDMTAINNSSCHGILTENITTTTNIYRNNIYNLSSTGTPIAAIVGIEVNTNATPGTTHNIYNNLVSQISINPAITSAVTPSIYGILVRRNNYNVYFNTVALGYGSALSSGGNFGVTGLSYAANTTSLDLRNNLIYVNAIRSGTGLVSALQRATGVATVAPTNFAATSNYNLYHSPNVANSYLYSEGTTVATAVNAYNLTNDPNFSSEPACGGLYKLFMTTAGEDSTITEDPPFIGAGAPEDKYNLSAGTLSYAESGAQILAMVPTDFVGVARPNNLVTNRPDIGFREFAGIDKPIILCPIILPIELVSFEGSSVNHTNLLKWVTSNELNNAYFTIERSVNGYDFEPIGTILGAGNSNTMLHYSLIDNNPPSLAYYRLKQTDYDENSKYSNTIVLENQIEGGISVYPNPSNGFITITIEESLVSQNCHLKLINVLGQVVFEKKHTESSSQTIDLTAYSDGYYELIITLGTKAFYKPIIIKKT